MDKGEIGPRKAATAYQTKLLKTVNSINKKVRLRHMTKKSSFFQRGIRYRWSLPSPANDLSFALTKIYCFLAAPEL